MPPIVVTIVACIVCGTIGLAFGAALARRRAGDCAACIARRSRRNRRQWTVGRPHVRKPKRHILGCL
jgi:hypothetical protein